MSNPVLNSPPDWSVEPDLLCPLCGYNLRGLTQPRCPECGFAFQWQELKDAETTRHKYLFEHGRSRNLKTFWKTYWTTCRPRKFWRDVRPTHTVNLFRLIIYWVITVGLFSSVFLEPQIHNVIELAQINAKSRAALTRLAGYPAAFKFGPYYGFNTPPTPAQIDATYPSPLQRAFWSQYISSSQSTFYRNFSAYSYFNFDLIEPYRRAQMWLSIFLAWPWLTILSLFVFQASMRRAKLRKIHLLRTVIYSCDFGLLICVIFVAFAVADLRIPNARFLFFCAMLCFTITTYRLTIASKKYLHLHLPLATTLASQAITLLFVIVILLQIADFTRGI